jgi:hypothetical protein
MQTGDEDSGSASALATWVDVGRDSSSHHDCRKVQRGESPLTQFCLITIKQYEFVLLYFHSLRPR